MADVVAALDCGSNSTRLLTQRRDGTVVHRETRITRLSEGVDASRRLTDAAMERSFAVLDEYRAIMDADGVGDGLLVATSAVRDAANGPAFLTEAGRRAGVDARILTGAEEAAFSYAGATADLDVVDEPTLVLDVGGGSTELATGLADGVHSYSMQLGCVRVTERALGRDAVTPERVAAARAMIDGELDAALAAEPALAGLGEVRLVGLAGTVATLAQLIAGESVYRRELVHHRRIGLDTVVEWRDRLSGESPGERLAHPGMVVGREDVLPAGLFVVSAVMTRFGASELLTSESDILDGVAASR
ncbi:MAG: exopolyphosphatase [Acidimicrobiales bacterium]